MFAVALAAAACTKPNPEASCAKDGKCTNPGFPLCDVTGAVGGTAGMCLPPCVPGTIGACPGSDSALVCNSSANGYDTESCPFGCDATSNVCTTKCTAHAQCTSGICKEDGSCAADSEIVHTSANGSPTSDCSAAAPCTLGRAVSLQVSGARQYILLNPGVYSLPGSLTIGGHRSVIGGGASGTSIRSTGMGPIMIVDAGADVDVEGVAITDAKGNPPNSTDGFGISVPGTPPGMRTLRVADCVFTNNFSGAINGGTSNVDIRRSQFDGNGAGIYLNGELALDSCSFTSNSNSPITFDGNFTVTNNFIARNGAGVSIGGATTTPTFEFNTIVDNLQYGLDCEYYSTGVPSSMSNNIVARNTMNLATFGGGTACTDTGSIVTADVTALHFAHPDSAPYDYHLGPGSMAIDAAQGSSTLDHDYDGDARPKGAARDVGADEAN